MVILDNYIGSLEVIVPFGYCIVYSKGFLFSGTPFALCFGKSMQLKMLLETQFHRVPGKAVLHKHHQKHQCI